MLELELRYTTDKRGMTDLAVCGGVYFGRKAKRSVDVVITTKQVF